nr:MAG TPA: TFIIB zinc-binding [Caudoviricetes sp.]
MPFPGSRYWRCLNCNAKVRKGDDADARDY